MVRAGTKADFTLALGWLRCGFPVAMIHRTVKKSFTVGTWMRRVHFWLQPGRIVLPGYCVANLRLWAGAKRREVVEMQPGPILPVTVRTCIVWAIGRTERGNQNGERMRPAEEFFFQLEYPIKPSAFARFILRDAKAVHCGLQGDRSGSQRLTFPWLGPSLGAAGRWSAESLGPSWEFLAGGGTWWPTLPQWSFLSIFQCPRGNVDKRSDLSSNFDWCWWLEELEEGKGLETYTVGSIGSKFKSYLSGLVHLECRFLDKNL